MLGAGRRETARGGLGSLVGAGACQKPACWLLNVACITFSSCPGPVHVPPRPRRGGHDPRAGAQDSVAARPCPAGPGTCGAAGRQAPEAGRPSGQHRPLHAARQGPWPAPRHRGVRRPSPPSCTATQSQWLFLPGSGTCGKGPGTPSPATWARADALGLPDAKDLGGAGRGHCALYLPSPGPVASWEWP